MSDQLRIAGALRKLDDEALAELAKAREINTANLRDFFDLAESLSTDKSLRLALSKLWFEPYLDLLKSSNSNSGTQSRELARLLLVDPDSSMPWQSIMKLLEQIKFAHLDSMTLNFAQGEAITPSIEQIDRDARSTIYDLLQAITEVILDLEQRYIKEVGRNSIGLPEIKRLAAHLGRDNDYARRVFELALFTRVAAIEDSRWQLGPQAKAWLAGSDQDRWLLLASAWIEFVAQPGLRDNILSVSPGESFEDAFASLFKQQLGETQNYVDEVVELAEEIGLTSSGYYATTWRANFLAGKTALAAKQMTLGLPQAERRLIVQADLTLIAPGPLPTNLEVELRTFVETERIGMASTYRLSPLSISNGLESGMTIDLIRDLLTELSGKPLPQPVEYLLGDVEKKFGRIRIRQIEGPSQSQVLCDDPIVLTTMLNDVKLKPLSLRFESDGSLVSRFDCDIIYYALREAGYIAVQVDEMGKVISPLTIATPKFQTDSLQAILADIQRMREADQRIGSNDGDDAITRQIQLAIKLKSKLKITVKTSKGESLTFMIEPTGLANGRVRGKDRRADVERTLPLDSIESIELV